MNCEDEDYGEKPFSYCGKKNCESCGGEEKPKWCNRCAVLNRIQEYCECEKE